MTENRKLKTENCAARPAWLMKTEPDVFSFAHLKSRANRTEPWNGVRNFQARNFMRDAMRPGDLVLFYHSNCATPGVVGLAEVASAPYPDPTQFDPEHRYYDPKSTPENPRWFQVDVGYERHLKRLISLDELKADDTLADLPLVRRGNRLSIMPVPAPLWHQILAKE